MVNVPLSALPNQELMMFLNGQRCTIHVYQRGERLYLDLYLANDPVQLGAIIMPKAPVITRVNHKFNGQFRICDLQNKPGKAAIPHYTGLGTQFYLFYLTDEEERTGAKY